MISTYYQSTHILFCLLLWNYGWIADSYVWTTTHFIILALIHLSTTLYQSTSLYQSAPSPAFSTFPLCWVILVIMQISCNTILFKTNKNLEHTYPSGYHSISLLTFKKNLSKDLSTFAIYNSFLNWNFLIRLLFPLLFCRFCPYHQRLSY